MERSERTRREPLEVEQEAPSQPFSLSRMTAFGGLARIRMPVRARDLAYMPEPDQELEGSELTDAERRAAIARERMRREGLT